MSDLPVEPGPAASPIDDRTALSLRAFGDSLDRTMLARDSEPHHPGSPLARASADPPLTVDEVAPASSPNDLPSTPPGFEPQIQARVPQPEVERFSRPRRAIVEAAPPRAAGRPTRSQGWADTESTPTNEHRRRMWIGIGVLAAILLVIAVGLAALRLLL